jgi:hypothetical protein
MLYRSPPEWEEPADVRDMLDASEDLETIPEDAVRTQNIYVLCQCTDNTRVVFAIGGRIVGTVLQRDFCSQALMSLQHSTVSV